MTHHFGWQVAAPGGGFICSALHAVLDAVLHADLNSAASSSFTALVPGLWFTGMSKRLPGLVIEVEDLPGFLAKSDEDILRHVRSVLLLRAYAVQRAQLAKCDGVQFSPTKDSCVFSAKGRALLHVRFAQLKA